MYVRTIYSSWIHMWIFMFCHRSSIYLESNFNFFSGGKSIAFVRKIDV